MKLFLPCTKCREEFGQLAQFLFVEVRDDSTYRLTCPFEHKTVMVHKKQKFEVLSEIGANAILDGYYREAVSSFASSLERFYEFAIQVLLESSGASEKLFETSWKKVSNESPKQLGAFIFLWASCFNETPKLLSDDQVKYRNKVIHKGIIPTKEEALKFGNAVIDVIRPQIQQLQNKFLNEVRRVTSYHLRDIYAEVGMDMDKVATMSTLSPISLTDKEGNQLTLETYLNEMKEYLNEMKKVSSLVRD